MGLCAQEISSNFGSAWTMMVFILNSMEILEGIQDRNFLHSLPLSFLHNLCGNIEWGDLD
jgi:hypothetical protein